MSEQPVALVTGSSRGIGRGIAEALDRAGYAVAVHCVGRIDAAQEVAASLRSAAAFQADVRSAEAVDELFSAVEAELGPVDVLVNNAGLHRGGRVDRLALEDWNAVLDTNLSGAFHCVRRAVPAMREQQWGRIVMIASPVALRGYAGDAAYGAAKAGLVGMTRCLAVELARTGITVNAVVPGFVETEMTGSLSERSRSRIIEGLPMGVATEAADVGAAVAFLAGRQADQITGVTLPVDGALCV